MSVSLGEILAGAAAHAVPLSAECAGYLVLAAADQTAHAPRRVDANEVRLLEDGAVRLMGGAPADDRTAEGDLRELLGGLLSMASSATAGLLRARRKAVGGGVGSLLRELETALIPVNRAAARRALARLARETVRAKDEGRLVPQAELDELPRTVRSEPAPEVASERAPDVHTVELARPVAVEPPPSSVISPTPAPAGMTVPLPPVAETAPPQAAPTQEDETRPEPVVLRASARPPAPPPDLVGATPVLGTRVAPSTLPAPPPLPVDEAPRDVEVTFSDDERTMIPDDHELIVSLGEGTAPAPDVRDLTEPCPPILLESDRAPEAESRAFAESPSASELPEVAEALPEVAEALPEVAAELLDAAGESDEVADESLDFADESLDFADESDESLEVAPDAAELASLLVDDAEADAETRLLLRVEPAVGEPSEPSEAAPLESATVLPPWVTEVAPEPEATPVPHVSLPGPRESSVEDLIARMSASPVGADDVCSGLKRLAGLEPTPPPPGSTLDD